MIYRRLSHVYYIFVFNVHIYIRILYAYYLWLFKYFLFTYIYICVCVRMYIYIYFYISTMFHEIHSSSGTAPKGRQLRRPTAPLLEVAAPASSWTAGLDGGSTSGGSWYDVIKKYKDLLWILSPLLCSFVSFLGVY